MIFDLYFLLDEAREVINILIYRCFDFDRAKKRGINLMPLFFALSKLQIILVKYDSDAETNIMVERSVQANRIVIDLHGTEINFVIDFDVQSAAERH